MDYSILINTCDNYSDIWPVFFEIFKRTWTAEVPAIFLNTEKKHYQDNDLQITCLNLDKGINNAPWGKRLIKALEQVPHEYVLMLLEDFLFEQEIRTERIESCCRYLENDLSIAAFQLTPNGEFEKGIFPEEEERYKGFSKRRKGDLFTVVAGPTLWRKSDLLRLTKTSDNPWEWEFFGSFRTILYGKDIYGWRSKNDCIFKYDVDHGGAIHRGKWVGYKMHELEKKYDIKIDYGDREIVEDWMKMDEYTKPVPWFKRMGSIIKNRTMMITNTLYGLKCRF